MALVPDPVRDAGNTALVQLMRAGRAPDDRRSPSAPLVVQRQPITPTSIGEALSHVTADEKTQRVSSLRPWEMFKYVPWNPSGGEKKRVFVALNKAHQNLDRAVRTLETKRSALAKLPKGAKPRTVNKATAAVAAAETKVTAAKGALPGAVAKVKTFIKAHLDSSRNPAIADLKAQIKDAKKKVARAGKRAAAADRSAVTTLEAQLATKLAAMRAEIDAADYAPAIVERTTATWTVGDAKATVYDNVEAYATITASGLEGKAALAAKGGPTVSELLAKDTTLGASAKRILGIISEFEGQFSSLNTWDIADVTWGMVQWTTGASGKGDLIAALKIIKAQEPDAFETRLRTYGIDVADDGIVLTRPDGTVLRGLQAAKALAASAQLSAVLAASGADPKIQVAQLKASFELEVRKPLETSISVTCADGKKTVKVSDVVTSEAGVGALANQTVHGGYPSGTVRASFNAAAKKAKKADAASTWAPDAEDRLIKALRKADPERVATMVKRLATAAGTYK